MFFSLGNTPQATNHYLVSAFTKQVKPTFYLAQNACYPTGTASVLTNKTRFCVLPSNPARVLPRAKHIYPTSTTSVLPNKTRFCVLPSAKRVYLVKPSFTLNPHAGLNSETIEYPASFSPFLMNAICSAFRVSITTRKKQAVTLLVLLFRS